MAAMAVRRIASGVRRRLRGAPREAPDAESTHERPWSEVLGAEGFDEAAVRELLASAGYPAERVHVVVGSVEETLPHHAPEALALLRLDTDWYESTRHELEHLYPRLADGGVLIV